MSILDVPIISRIRRNHGLEHASITLLTERFPYRSLAGYSYPGGFFLIGDIPTEHVRDAVMQALTRMNNGERFLAIHPNCGTNYAVSGIVAGTLAWLGMTGAKTKRDKVERLPVLIGLATLGLILGTRLGPLVQQRITTSGDPAGMAVVNIFPVRIGGFSMHQVITQG